MASSIQKLHDHYLSCIICTELYKDPCTLVCGHTFCKECLVKYTKTQPDAIKAKSILCPNCRQITTVHNTDTPVEDWVKDIKPSFLIQGLLDDFASQAGVDTRSGNVCIPCTQTGEKTPASSYCMDCDLAMCDKCCNVHKVMPISAHHHVSILDGAVKRRRKVICKIHKILLEFCCKNCNKAICQKCCILDHRKCDNVVTMESMVPEMKSVLEEMKTVMACEVKKTGATSRQKENLIKETEAKKTQIHFHITKFIESIVNMMYERKQQLLDELQTHTEKRIGDLKQQVKSEEIDKQTYQQHLEFIEQALKAESEMNMYEMYQMCQSGSVGLSKHTGVEKEEVPPVPWDIAFVVSDEHKTGCHPQLGRLVINEEKPIINDFNPNCKPTLVDTICIKTKSCMKRPDPVDVKVLNVNGIETLVITDYSNKSVKSFYTRHKQSCNSILQLSEQPWTLSQLNGNTVAFSYYSENEVAVVNVTPDLVLLYNIKTHKPYRCLATINETTLVAGCRCPSSLDIIDMSGQVLRSITPSESLINRPFGLAVTKGGNILVSDWGSDSLYCLTQEGQVVFKFPARKDVASGSPCGVVISNSGYILLSDWNNKVVQLTSTGEYVRDILTSDNICNPYGICLHNHKLYVVQYRDSLKVFSLV